MMHDDTNIILLVFSVPTKLGEFGYDGQLCALTRPPPPTKTHSPIIMYTKYRILITKPVMETKKESVNVKKNHKIKVSISIPLC